MPSNKIFILELGKPAQDTCALYNRYIIYNDKIIGLMTLWNSETQKLVHSIVFLYSIDGKALSL